MTWVPDDFRATLVASGFFDPVWYRDRLRSTPHRVPRGSDPLDHFLSVGLAEHLDPGPSFSAARYLFDHPDVLASGLHPVVHYLVSGAAEGRTAHPVPSGRRAIRFTRAGSQFGVARSMLGRTLPGRRRRPLVLVVGHAAGAELFGAERSLLDVLDGFAAIGIATVVAVPRSTNQAYLADLRARSIAVEQVAIGPSAAPLVEQYGTLIDRHRVDAVHVNTIVPLAALSAARMRGIPAVANVREIPFDDPDLCRQLGHADAASIVATVLATADHLLAPSMAAAEHYPLPTGVSIVPCVVDVDRFHAPTGRRPVMRVGLVGALHEKKGIIEFVELARQWQARFGDPERSQVEFVAVGTTTPTATRLRDHPDTPDHLVWTGYRPDPVSAIAEVDVLLNLSTCIEAFGRTVLEAAAAGKPAIAYHRGGPAEVIDDGVTGFLVEPGDLAAVADRIAELCADPGRFAAMGAAARHRARVRYSPDALADALAVAYASVLPSAAVRRARHHDGLVPLHTVNRSDHRRPFYVASRGRFAGATAVRFVDDHTLVTASLLGRRLHVVGLTPDRTSGTIVAELPTVAGRVDDERPVLVDLLDARREPDGTCAVVTSNCDDSSVSMFTIDGHNIRFEQSMAVGGTRPGYVHGVSFVDGQPALVAAAITTGTPRVTFASREHTPVPDDIVIEGWRPKATAALPGHLAITSARHNVDVLSGQWNDARLDIVRLHPDGSHTIVATATFTDSTADSCAAVIPAAPARGRRHRPCIVLMADQLNDRIVVVDVTFRSDGSVRLQPRRPHIGSSFPHDAAYSPDGRMVAMAEYGTDSVRLRPLR